MASHSFYYVYVLESERKVGATYVGMTDDLRRQCVGRARMRRISASIRPLFRMAEQGRQNDVHIFIYPAASAGGSDNYGGMRRKNGRRWDEFGDQVHGGRSMGFLDDFPGPPHPRFGGPDDVFLLR